MFNKMKAYFELQYKMTNRRFKDTGFAPWLAYIILTLGFVALSIYLFAKTEFAQYAYMLAALTLIGKLSETQRTEFLKICFGDTKLKKIRVAENFICALPFLIFRPTVSRTDHNFSPCKFRHNLKLYLMDTLFKKTI